jgi:hypothetical protein
MQATADPLSCDVRATVRWLQCTKEPRYATSRCRAGALDKYDVMDGLQYVDTPEAHTFCHVLCSWTCWKLETRTENLCVINRLPLLSGCNIALHPAFCGIFFRLANTKRLRTIVCAVTLTHAFFPSLYHLCVVNHLPLLFSPSYSSWPAIWFSLFLPPVLHKSSFCFHSYV